MTQRGNQTGRHRDREEFEHIMQNAVRWRRHSVAPATTLRFFIAFRTLPKLVAGRKIARR